MAVNISEVRLLAVPLQADYKNTAYFSSASEQAEYFAGKVKLSTTNVSYIKDNVFTYPADYDDLQNVNYVMYRNNAYTDKWFYAFITDKERLNDGATRVHIKTDSIQTYLFDYQCGCCFVEREHVKDDTIGAHTIPEGLEMGEYICNNQGVVKSLQDLVIVVGSTVDLIDYSKQPDDWNLTKEFRPVYGGKYNDIYSGLRYYALNSSFLSSRLKSLAYEGQEDAVYTIFMAPKAMLNLIKSDQLPSEYYIATSPVLDKEGPKTLDWEGIPKPDHLNGYVPNNNKLFTYPYCYLLVDNGGGTAVTYHYEKFSGDEASFKIYGTICPGMSIRAVPQNYNGVDENDAEGINLAKYSTCAWTTDAYTAWLAKNGASTGISTLAGLGAIVGGIAAAPATGGASLALAGGAVAGGVATVANNLATVAQHSELPPQLHGNINNGDVATSKGDVTFKTYGMTIKKEYAKIIDDYFTRFGYKVNSFKFPNTNHRKFFWYTKTIDAVILGDIPQNDLQTIKNCYDQGITFYRNPDQIGAQMAASGGNSIV